MIRQRKVAETVNWRPGSLWPYESLAAVGAKFAYLNRVPPSAFRRLLSRFAPPFASDEFLSLIDHPQFSIGPFARMIGEPEHMVLELKVAPFVLPENFISKRSPGVFRIQPRDLRYCPACAMLGFHALFHQLDWFSRCLLHDIELRTFSRARDKKWMFPRRDDRIVADAFELLFMCDTGWEFLRKDAWLPEPRRTAGWKAVGDYLLLAEDTRSKCAERGKRVIDFGRSAFWTRSGPVEALKWHHWPKSIPKRVESCLHREEFSACPESLRIANRVDGFPSLDDIFCQNLSIHSLLETRLNSVLLCGEEPSWLRAVQKCIDDMLVGHRGCWTSFTRCHDLPWPRPLQRVEMSTKTSYLTIFKICPRVIAIQKLHEKWLIAPVLQGSFYSDVPQSSNRDDILRLEERNLVERVNAPTLFHDFIGHPRVYNIATWRIRDDRLQSIVDTILEAMVMQDIWNLWQFEMDLRDNSDNVTMRSSIENEWLLCQVSADIVELQMWNRTPQNLPNWTLANRADHNGEEYLWKWVALRNRFDIVLEARQSDWMCSAEAERIATQSWETEGKNWMEIDRNPPERLPGS